MEQGETSHNWEVIAESVYKAYSVSMGHTAADGDFIRPWDALSSQEQIAWQAAARHSVNLHNWISVVPPEKILELEQSWERWRPN